MTFTRTSLVLAALLAASACGKEDAPPVVTTRAIATPGRTVTEIELGNSITAQDRVSMPMTTFSPKDTVYASIVTDGAPEPAKLAAVWNYHRGGDRERVDSSSRTIAPDGPAATTFFVTRPKGWPMGTYSVEVFADGKSVGMRDFEVK